LATYLAARLADDVLDENGLSPAVRVERSGNARSWLSTVALPAPVRQPLARLIDSTGGQAAPVSQALRAVMAVTAEFLDRASRLELEQLAETLEAQALVK
jgi:pyocin large subunit-like protein